MGVVKPLGLLAALGAMGVVGGLLGCSGHVRSSEPAGEPVVDAGTSPQPQPPSSPEPTPVEPEPEPEPPQEPACFFIPRGQFEPALECAWNGPAAGSQYATLDDVVMTPVVVNLTDDNSDGKVTLDDIPDIAFVSYSLQDDQSHCPQAASCGCCNSSGVLRVVSGGCIDGTLPEHFTVGPDEIAADIGTAGIWLDNSGGLAVGDIDADGSVDIVATTQNGGTIAFERNGVVKWYQAAHPSPDDHLAATQPAIADVDADGKPEVIQGRVVLNGEDGSLKWLGLAGVGTNGFLGPVSSAGDLDLNGTLNVLAGPTNYDSNGADLWTYSYDIPISNSNCRSDSFPCDGFTATGNFDADDEGEVVIVRAGIVYVLNHDGSPMDFGGMPIQIEIPSNGCSKNEGGPPTVADFDGDNDPEIGVAGADFYIVADLECLVAPLPAHCSDPGIRWKVKNDDCSSRVTGSSVFDFDGDGQAEVVYNDEVEFRILSGVDGTERYRLENYSHTRLEMPIVVDVDNDGNAEIVFVENPYGDGAAQGVRVWGDAADTWVATRRIWNQHAYHVTNVTELGGIPAVETPNWLAPTPATASGVMNNFRQNLPEADAFLAPDLTVDLLLDEATCSLAANVCNEGDLVVGAGVAVRFYETGSETPIACAGTSAQTSMPLNPGVCEIVTCAGTDELDWPVAARACVDNEGFACTDGATAGNNECQEDNNASDGLVYGCTVIP